MPLDDTSSGYTTLKLPVELARKIDEYVNDNPWGYRSRAEIVAEAVRKFLRELREAEQLGIGRPAREDESPKDTPTTARRR